MPRNTVTIGRMVVDDDTLRTFLATLTLMIRGTALVPDSFDNKGVIEQLHVSNGSAKDAEFSLFMFTVEIDWHMFLELPFLIIKFKLQEIVVNGKITVLKSIVESAHSATFTDIGRHSLYPGALAEAVVANIGRRTDLGRSTSLFTGL